MIFFAVAQALYPASVDVRLGQLTGNTELFGR